MAHHIAGWSSLVARRAHNPKVVGSNPAPATKSKQSLLWLLFLFCRVMSTASVARWVSEAKIVRWTVFVSGVAPSASFKARLCLAKKTTHDCDRPTGDNPKVVGWIRPPRNQKSTRFFVNLVDFTYYLFTLHYSLKRLVDFWKVISNTLKGTR